jgi:hypothetical protein
MDLAAESPPPRTAARKSGIPTPATPARAHSPRRTPGAAKGRPLPPPPRAVSVEVSPAAQQNEAELVRRPLHYLPSMTFQ